MASPAPASNQSVLERFWPHITAGVGAVAAIALGAADHFVAHDAWGIGVDLSLIWGGLGALGVATVAAVKS